MFSPTTYSDRRNRLGHPLSGGLLLFLGNEESSRNYRDNVHPFRQDSTFLYFLGLDRAGLSAVMDLDQGVTTLYGDDATLDDQVWTGPQAKVSQWAERAGLSKWEPASALRACLHQARREGRPIHFLPPYRDETRIKLFELLDIPPSRQASSASASFIQAVVAQRSLKTPEEVEELDRAVGVTVDMHLAAMAMARPGLKEAAIMAKVTETALAQGCGLSFPVIATVRGETLHNPFHRNELQAGQVFLLDAGAETAMGYAGDLTSSFPVGPRFTPAQREIYQVVLGAHLAAVNALRPGVPYLDIHRLACRTLTEGLKGMGLMKGDVDEAVALGAHALFFPCGVGHMMGLDVHDMENLGEGWVGYEGRPKSTQFGLKSLRLGRELRPGFVVTVEPGIYFIPELLAAWRAEGRCKDFLDFDAVESFQGFGGIRIEEDFLITPGGARLLGKPKPRTLDEVEAVRGGCAFRPGAAAASLA